MNRNLLSACVLALGAVPVQAVPDGFATPSVGAIDGFSHRLAPDTHTRKMVRSRTEAQQQALDFSLAYDYYMALKLNLPVGTEIHEAFFFSASNCGLYAGKSVTSVNVVTGCYGDTEYNGITDVYVFISETLDGEPLVLKKGKLSGSAFTLSKVTLDEPYLIEAGKPFYVGCFFKTTSSNDYYVVVDGMPTQNAAGGYYGVKQGDEVTWNNLSSMYGSICLGMTIEGEGLPENGVNIYGVNAPGFAEPGKPFTFDIAFSGAAVKEAESVELEYQIGSQDAVTVPISLEEPLGFNNIGIYRISDVSVSEIGIDLPFTISVSKVNGAENVADKKTLDGSINCFDSADGFTPRTVVEEGTGTWCGWCPAGIVMMDYIKEKYPEDFICVALHSGDEMQASSASQVINYFSGFPSAMLNRSEIIGPTDPQILQYIDSYHTEVSTIPAFAEVSDLDVVVNGDGTASIPTTVRFATDYANNNRYRLSYYITEDNVGPYEQINNYAGGAEGEMGGYENEPSPFDCIFDDVARRLVGGASGVTGSLPENITAGEDCNYEALVTLAEVEGDEFFVTAMIVDSATGSIANARQIKASKDYTGIDNVNTTAGVTVYGSADGIVFSGSYSHAAVYDASGRQVAVAAGEPKVSLLPGLYIVIADGVSSKVAVR